MWLHYGIIMYMANKKCTCEFGLEMVTMKTPDGEHKMGHIQVLMIPLHNGVQSVEFTIHHNFGESHTHTLVRNTKTKGGES